MRGAKRLYTWTKNYQKLLKFLKINVSGEKKHDNKQKWMTPEIDYGNTTITVENATNEKVFKFKYLGVWLKPDWSSDMEIQWK